MGSIGIDIPLGLNYGVVKHNPGDSIKETICFILPYIIIAIFVMYYNYARFGSILDFGANYNLTTNDMTARGIHFERFLSAIYYYLFACPRITNVFPFIETIPLNTSYIGITIYELTFGGTFMLCPILFISLFLSNNLKDSPLERQFSISYLSSNNRCFFISKTSLYRQV